MKIYMRILWPSPPSLHYGGFICYITIELPLCYSDCHIIIVTESRFFFSKIMRRWWHHAKMTNLYYINNFSLICKERGKSHTHSHLGWRKEMSFSSSAKKKDVYSCQKQTLKYFLLFKLIVTSKVSIYFQLLIDISEY